MTDVYAELRAFAADRLAHDPAGATLDATALVHEAYVRLADHGFTSDRHFFHAAALAMRRILVDRARAKSAQKRDAGHRVPLPDVATEETVDLVALDDALTALAAEDEQAAELVHLRFFAGRTRDESAALLGISPRQADRLWAFAKAWLFRRLSDS
jgi:RNA polymerase sigma factor (TIGR02999 family)